MKTLLALSLVASFSITAFANTNTTGRSGYDPVHQYDSEMIQSEEERYEENLDRSTWDQQRMEERTNFERNDSEAINYTDRTRTNRERKALNTGSNASDDR